MSEVAWIKEVGWILIGAVLCFLFLVFAFQAWEDITEIEEDGDGKVS